MKPNPEFFKTVIETEGIVPEESVFIDDGPRNVKAASGLGLNTLCPENGIDWKADLYAMLGLWFYIVIELNITFRYIR